LRHTFPIVMVLIVFNLVIVWFDAMGFFRYHPVGTWSDFNVGAFLMKDVIFGTYGFLAIGISILGGIAAKLLNINAFKMIMYMEIFWLPYTRTISIFHEVLKGTSNAFLLIITIFTIVMSFVFLYDLIEMSGEV